MLKQVVSIVTTVPEGVKKRYEQRWRISKCRRASAFSASELRTHAHTHTQCL